MQSERAAFFLGGIRVIRYTAQPVCLQKIMLQGASWVALAAYFLLAHTNCPVPLLPRPQRRV